jgi:hypothetical protein
MTALIRCVLAVAVGEARAIRRARTSTASGAATANKLQ